MAETPDSPKKSSPKTPKPRKKASAKAAGRPAPRVDGTVSFEDALGRVEDLIVRIESGEIGLEESLARYEEGVALIKRCRAILDVAEQRVEELADDLEGQDDTA
ncbi:MAG: exodeoxyribonuclease VII small subunit [Planctomycetota bacterium]